MPKAKTVQDDAVYTYRVRPDGDGRYYVGAKYDVDGNELAVVTSKYMSEPDAEKELRSIVSGSDVIAVSQLHSVDAEDNKHIVLETSEPEDVLQNGAAVRYVGDPVDAVSTPATDAVANDNVSSPAS